MQITLRPAGVGDIPTVLMFMKAYYAYDHLVFNELAALEAVTTLITNSELGRLWLVVHNSREMGYAVLAFGYSLELQGRDAFIDELYIEEEYRGQGLGTQVMQQVEVEARGLNVRTLHLEVDRKNTRVHRLYRAQGFIPRERYVLMSKDLRSRKE